MTSPHLYVALSPHGYGHAAMTAPVVNRLRALVPGLRVTLQTTTPRDWLESRYDGPFALVAESADFGMRMTSTLVVDVAASAEAYRSLHRRLAAVVAHEAERLRRLEVDLVLANVPYVTLLAAKQANVPALAYCCLNWMDIYRSSCGDRPEAPAILAAMAEGYGSAETFLQPVPTMPMADLPNRRTIGPVSRRGTARRAELGRMLGVEPGQKVGLIAFGGMEMNLPFARWPRLPGWRWVTTAPTQGHPDLVERGAVPMDFTDLLCSVDVIIGKPGYGTFAEAAVNGTPFLTLPRPGWPEAPYLVEWLERVGRCLSVEAEELFDGAVLARQLRTLFSMENKPLVEPSGVEEAAQAVLAALGKSRRTHM
jgi:hypothetical protein